MKQKKPWGGRFTKQTAASVESFTESVSFDWRLYKYDIEGSIAHATMLARCRLITEKEKTAIVKGLNEILSDILSGKFEFKSSYVQDNEKYASYINKHLGVPLDRVGFPQWVEPKYYGGGDLHFISPKLALQAEGRAGNLPQAAAIAQPVVGGRRTVYLEIHPEAAAKRGIRDGDRVRIKSEAGSIEAVARHYEGVRPDVVVLPNIHGHWAQGRWARNRLPTGSASEVIVNESEPISGLAAYYASKVTVERV